MNFARTRALVRSLRSFVTIPGAVSLAGIALALVLHGADRWLGHGGLIPGGIVVPVDTARSVLSTAAAAAVSALVMVYSIVLLVYTMAASSIGPRLLQRFREDRINQFAVGMLGATFLYCLTMLWLTRGTAPASVGTAGALVLAVVSILLLLYFVNTVSARVTIDQEAAAIARTLDHQINSALAVSARLGSDDVVLPQGVEWTVICPENGYLDTIAGSELAKHAAKRGATVVYAVRPGDFIMEGETLATVIGGPGETLGDAVCQAAPLIAARDPAGDLRFSVNLLVEIALRALSPGVNDTFTAIGCVDRLSASLSRARRKGLSIGVFDGPDGAVRVVFPTVDAKVLFDEAFPPLRRAARGNGLMTISLTRALRRMALAAPVTDRGLYLEELGRLRDDLEGCDLPDGDIAQLAEGVRSALEDLEPAREP